MELKARLRTAHPKQNEFIVSNAKRKVIRAGRRSGKTTGIGILAIEAFLKGRRILYATPTQEQVDRFWQECKRALHDPIEQGVFYKNETRHIIELPGTEQRIRAKTAWNSDTLRGDYADLLIFDEYQLMGADAWGLVGAPMLLDNDGDAVFIYTAIRGRHHSKELFKKAAESGGDRWQTFVFNSFDNPYISKDAINEVADDMTQLAYRSEILAEEIDDDPRALWSRGIIDHVTEYPELARIAVGVDPPGTKEGAECGIITGGVAMVGDKLHGYVLSDRSLQGTPAQWSSEVIVSYNLHNADRVLGEVNFGGEMVEHTIRSVAGGENISYQSANASRGKSVRAEPVVALYEQVRIHHVGEFKTLEDEQCNWVPGVSGYSPNRIDALVWVFSKLMLASEWKSIEFLKV